MIDISDLVSGFIGAGIGVFGAWALDLFRSYSESKSRVRKILLVLGHGIWREGDSNAVSEILDRHYEELTDAITDLHERMWWMPWQFEQRTRILNLGYSLMGHNPKSRLRFTHSHLAPQRLTIIKTIEELLEILGYSYDSYFKDDSRLVI